MKAGWMRHSIQIQAPTRVVDAGGGVSITWATIANGTVQAQIQPLASSETMQSDQLQDYTSHKLTLRWLPGVTTGHRVLFGARWFDIKSVVDVQERHHDMVILAQERVAK